MAEQQQPDHRQLGRLPRRRQLQRVVPFRPEQPGQRRQRNGLNAYDGSNFNLFEGNYIASAYDGINFMSPNARGNIARNNIIGESPLGQDAPLGRYGINVRNNTRSHVIEGNRIRNTANHGIAPHPEGHHLGAHQPEHHHRHVRRCDLHDRPATDANNTAAPAITTATTTRAAGTGISRSDGRGVSRIARRGRVRIAGRVPRAAVVANNGSWSDARSS